MSKPHRILVSLSVAAALAITAPFTAARPSLRFTEAAASLGIPFDASNRTIGVSVRVNGEPMRFVLDTGAAGGVLDEAWAEALHLPLDGVRQSHGAGGFAQGSTVHGVRIELPGLELADQTLGTLSLAAISARSGRPMDGILGAPFFQGVVVEADYPKGRLSLFDAESFKYSGKGVAVPIELVHGQPYVTASLVLPDGRSMRGRFVIDTGASTAVILNSETVAREKVLESAGASVVSKALGVGGEVDMRLTRAKSLQLGGFELAKPVIVLQSPGPGRISAPGTLGNIGGGILSRFKVIFDYARERMILEPGPALADAFEADMSGLMLVATPPDFKVIRVGDVIDGSPADAAGITEGDAIESIDGTPAPRVDIPALREKLKREGESVTLVLRKDDAARTITLKTRRLI